LKIRGPIHMIELDSKIIGLKINKKIEFFYFQNSQMNLFKKYLYQDNWIEFEYNENKVIKGKFECHQISYVYKIEAIGKLDHIVYYDKFGIVSSLSDFLNSFDNMMFLDLEMTMPSYQFKGKGQFRTEVIQTGIIILDKNGKELYKYSNYILPKLQSKISNRALDFLKLSEEEFYTKAISYDKFYDEFNDMLNKYNPAIIVYGKNDSIVLNDSYDINLKPSLKNKTRFVNILQLIKTYYELKNDPGLFKLYNVFYDIDENQIHDALDDCITTYKVFEAFKKDLETKEKLSKIREAFN